MSDESSRAAYGPGGEEALLTTAGGKYHLELRAIYYLHTNLAQQMAALQDDYLTFPQTAWQVSAVELRAFKELDERYAEGAVWSVMDFADQPGGAFAFLDHQAIAVTTGVSAEELESDDGLGAVETYLAHLGNHFMACWQEIAQFDVQVFPSPLPPSLPDLQAMFPGLNQQTPVIVTSFRVTATGSPATARVTLGIPQAYLLAMGASLQAVGESTYATTDTSNFHERLNYLEDVPIPVSVLLGKTEMTVADLQGLEEGDVIDLGTLLGAPLPVRVGNTTLLGKPGTTADGRRLVVQIVQAGA